MAPFHIRKTLHASLIANLYVLLIVYNYVLSANAFFVVFDLKKLSRQLSLSSRVKVNDCLQCHRTQGSRIDSLSCSTSQLFLSSSSSQHVDNDDIDENSHEDQSDSFVLSKAKWKRKRYLMIADCRKALQNDETNNNDNNRYNNYNKAVRKAEEMIRRWWIIYEHSGYDEYYKPTTEAYNVLLNAIAKSASTDMQAGYKAESILKNEMIEKARVIPNIVSYTTVMDAYAHQSKRDHNAAKHAERLLFELINLTEIERRPDLQVTAVTCDAVLNAWAQQGTWDSAERAEQILFRMEEFSSSTSSKTSSDGGLENIRPTEHTYATVIDAWAKCKNGNGGEAALRAQAILDRLLDESNPVKPDTVIFNACINAWATSKDPRAGNKAITLLKQMQELHANKGYDCKPDTVTYNCVLSAWSHSGHINAATQAEKVLQEMIIAHRDNPDIAPAPTTLSYNNVLNAWSKSNLDDAAQRAETILDFMIRSQKNDIEPDVYSFTSVLDTIAKSKTLPDKAVRARALLDRMLQLYTDSKNPKLRPTQIPFNVVLNAAAFSKIGTTDQQQREALQVAVQTVALMRNEGVPPDEVSYGNVIKAFNNLMESGPTRTNMAMSVFHKCCDDGHVGEFVWKEIRRAVPSKVLSDMLGRRMKKSISSINVRDLPIEWRRNTKLVTYNDNNNSQQGAQFSNRNNRRRKTNRKSSRQQENKITTTKKPSVVAPRFRTISEQSYQSGRDI